MEMRFLQHICLTSKKLLTRCTFRKYSTKIENVKLLEETYQADSFTNITPKIISHMGKNLHNQKYHPLNLIKARIEHFFHFHYGNRRGNPIFSIYDNLSPVVTTHQNFDSLLVPKDHVSREKSDTYYINQDILLRCHTSAHQSDLIKSGLDAFLVIGDVYRRDTIDMTHYPVFHQVEGVRLYTQFELFPEEGNPEGLTLFKKGSRTNEKQASLSYDATKVMELKLKKTLEELVRYLFQENLEMRWVDAYFPFTHPSWELEIKFQDDWLEMLGCGVMEQEILDKAGAEDKVGWAFGLGLERLAMKLFSIPDIRYFWSNDPGFHCQFKVDDPFAPITFKPVSQHPSCSNDISFWIPSGFHSNDFYDLVRTVGGELIEQVNHLDEFVHPKLKRTSHMYRIVYRHMDRNLTQEEVNKVHEEIEQVAKNQLGVEIR